MGLFSRDHFISFAISIVGQLIKWEYEIKVPCIVYDMTHGNKQFDNEQKKNIYLNMEHNKVEAFGE